MEASPPVLELGGPVPLLHHALAQTRQRAVHPLVEAPRLLRKNNSVSEELCMHVK